MAKEKDTSPKKDKKEKKEAKPQEDEVSYEDRVASCSPIAHPLASKKLTKKLYKTIKKASKAKGIKRGVKEVIKGLRKGSKGVVVIAGDISPIDVISHIPVLCEENDVSYIYTPSKQDLGGSANTKRPTSVVMILIPSTIKNKEAGGEYKETFEEVATEVKSLNERMITTV